MIAVEDFHRYFAECPLVAVIRGVTPDSAEAVGQAIYDAGIRILEVPLNSPDPLASIERLARRLGDRALIGAGTVLQASQVDEVKAVGGRLIVAPNTHVPVIQAAVAAGMVSIPGTFTPTEAFTAIGAGAHALKFFPAEAASPAVVKAQRAVLPKDIRLIVVGGVTAEAIPAWLEAGANGFGLGSSLYKPGQQAAETGEKAARFVRAVAG